MKYNEYQKQMFREAEITKEELRVFGDWTSFLDLSWKHYDKLHVIYLSNHPTECYENMERCDAIKFCKLADEMGFIPHVEMDGDYWRVRIRKPKQESCA